MKYIFALVFLSSFFYLTAQNTTTIHGVAPDYVGETIYVYGFQDLLSMEEEQLAVSEVKSDSTFSLTFENSRTQKVVLRAQNNFSYLYAAPNASYNIYLPLHDKDKIFRPLGNYVTSIFIDLDSSDINHQIIQLNNAIDRFYASNLVYFVRNKKEFINRLNVFKDSVYATIPSEESFLSTFVFYTFADVDMSVYTSERGNRLIFDGYLNKRKVLYDNEFYFAVIKKMYSQIFGQLNSEVNNSVYRAILKKSPSKIMEALEQEYTLAPVYEQQGKKTVETYSNQSLRELVMIKALAEAYYDKQYPKTNIIEILDSIAKHPKESKNGLIAQNVIKRLTWMSNGNPSPDFALTNERGKLLTLKSLEDKYIYFHFFKADYTETANDILLLKEIQARYGDIVQFISVYPDEGKKLNKKLQKTIETIPWSVVKLTPDDYFFKVFRVQSYPSYVLIDRTGMVIGAPALTPRPNGQYVTIDKVFFDIRKADEEMKKRNNR